MLEDKYDWFIDNIEGDLIDLLVILKENDCCTADDFLYFQYQLRYYIYNDNDKRFIDKFYNSFLDYYTSDISVENNSVLKNRRFYSFFINLYFVYRAYLFYCDDIESFSLFVDDVLNYDIKFNSVSDIKNFENCTEGSIIEFLDKSFDSFGELYSHAKIVDLDDFSMVSLFDEKWNLLCKIVLDFNNYKKNNDSYDKEILFKIINAMLGNDKDYFYDESMFYGNRFFYVNEKLKEIESNVYIREEIFSYILELNNDIFMALDFGTSRDSFTEYMDIVFDSDSYREIINKLNILKEAGSLYCSNKRKKALEKLNSLNDSECKAVYSEKVVSYPDNSNCINLVVKPEKIIDRMKELYSKIDNSFSYDFFDEVHSDVTCVSDFYENIDSRIIANKKSVYIKRKLLGFFRKDR